MRFAKHSVGAPVDQDLQDLIRCFLGDLGRQVEPWQVQHGHDALASFTAG